MQPIAAYTAKTGLNRLFYTYKRLLIPVTIQGIKRRLPHPEFACCPYEKSDTIFNDLPVCNVLRCTTSAYR